MNLNLDLTDIKDEKVRAALQILKESLSQQALPKGDWQFIEITVEKAQTALKVSHGLKFQPQDVIQTSLVGSGQVTWNYSQFDKTFVVLTTTGPCTVRAYIGRHREGSDA